MDSKPAYPELNDNYGGPPQYDQSNMGPPPNSVQPAVITAQPPVYIVQNPAPVNHLGSKPTVAVCPSCHARQVSTVNYKASTKTHLIATVLCLTTCCCCIPYMVDSCQSAEHTCASCGSYLGTYNN